MFESDNGNHLAHIIVIDQELFDSHPLDGIDSTAPVSYINRVENVRVTLVESLSELVKVLGDHFLIRGNSEVSDLLEDTTIIGLYGFFDFFLREGTKLMEIYLNVDADNESGDVTGGAFMETEQYSAKTINYICNLMYNLRFYKKYGIYLADCDETIKDKTSRNIPAIWDRRLPNLQPNSSHAGGHTYSGDNTEETKDRREDIGVDGREKRTASNSNTLDLYHLNEKHANDADNSVRTAPSQSDVPLGLILSKWMKLI